jgi:multidrug efflux pump subunit AcrA (membrane-fusion protein)
MPAEKEESVFYVGIKDPIEIRRSLLESAKEMLQYLQRAEKFKEVRREKEVQISKLKETVQEIQSLVRKLKSELPKAGLRAVPPHEEHKKKAVKKKTKAVKEEKAAPVKVEKPKEMTELEKLEAELGEIEGRLTKLV